MPNRQVHVPVGIASGAAVAVWCARDQRLEYAIAEMVGGALGGWAGSRLPDIIDLPSHPNHRSIGHGVLPCGVALAEAVRRLPDLQAYLREQASVREAVCPGGRDERLSLSSILLRFLAGASAGFVAGYASHLALDAPSSKSLPLIA